MRQESEPEPALFPLFLRLDGQRVVLAGGGEAAAAKARLLLASASDLHVFAPEADEDITEFAKDGRLTLHARTIVADDMAGARLCVVALDSFAEAEAVAALARAAGVLVNAVDKPALSDFIVPAIVDRTPVSIAIGTGGAAPALARDLRGRIEAAVPSGYADLARLCRRERPRVAAAIPDTAARRRFWDTVMEGPVADAALDGDLAEAERILREQLGEFARGVHHPVTGRATLIGAGPGDPELLTLRAVRALKRADVVMYDSLIDPAILDLARRDARRIDVGKRCGRHAMSQAAINRLIAQHARNGAHVVRLKGGDPSVFGRAGEELDTLRTAGISVRIVPGVTAACAAAASLGMSLTHRGLARSVHFVTGHGLDGKLPDHDWSALARAGGTIAAYMAVRTLPALAAALIGAGLSSETPAAAIENASRPDERHVRASLSGIAKAVAAAALEGPTLVLIGAALSQADAQAGTAKIEDAA